MRRSLFAHIALWMFAPLLALWLLCLGLGVWQAHRIAQQTPACLCCERTQDAAACALEQRELLSARIVRAVLWPQLLLLGAGAVLLALALARGLRPLHTLAARIRSRPADDLGPVDTRGVAAEIAPLVHAVNALIERQQQVHAHQKRFLADAAHQLKTPLAGLRMQADLAQRSTAGAQDLKLSLQHIGTASVRATHTVNQLLAMARAESVPLAQQPCDMAALVQDVVRDCLDAAMRKHIDLGYEGAAPAQRGVCLQGNPILLQEMVRNLIDNAIAYMPTDDATMPGVVTARVLADPYGQVLLVQVEDNGAGIAPAQRQQVFTPFYRTLGNAGGSGLGLSIVAEIARRHAATLTLQDARPRRRPRPGALFTVRFAGVAGVASQAAHQTALSPKALTSG